jgi:hypothetical protein
MDQKYLGMVWRHSSVVEYLPCITGLGFDLYYWKIIGEKLHLY